MAVIRMERALRSWLAERKLYVDWIEERALS
jgi:hypothetical protein